MFRLALILSMLASPAWAGCYEYSEWTSLTNPAPRAEVCVDGKCEETTVYFQCGNVHGAQHGYANGLKVFRSADGVLMSKNERLIDPKVVTCREIDEGACFQN